MAFLGLHWLWISYGTKQLTITYHFLQNKVQIKEVKLKKDYLNNDDVFLIDLGLKIYQV